MVVNQAQGLRPKRLESNGRAELRLLITVAALASVLGGWAAIAQSDQHRAAALARGTPGRQTATLADHLAPLPPLDPLPRSGTIATEAGTDTGGGRRAASPEVIHRAPRPFALTRSSR